MSAKELDAEKDGLKDTIETYERDLIIDALKITFGNESMLPNFSGHQGGYSTIRSTNTRSI